MGTRPIKNPIRDMYFFFIAVNWNFCMPPKFFVKNNGVSGIDSKKKNEKKKKNCPRKSILPSHFLGDALDFKSATKFNFL